MGKHNIEFKVKQSTSSVYPYRYYVSMYLDGERRYEDCVSAVPSFLFKWRINSMKNRFLKALQAEESFMVIMGEQNESGE